MKVISSQNDFYNDGLTNLQEFKYGTNPNEADTDGDSYDDKREIDAGTDPLDSEDKPGSKIWWILLMILLGGLVGVIIFVVYHKTNDKKETKPPQKPLTPGMMRPRPMGAMRPIRRGPTPEQIKLMRERMLQKKRQDKTKQTRDKTFSAFGGVKKEEGSADKTKPTKGKGVRKKSKIKSTKKPVKKSAKKDTISKLSSLADGGTKKSTKKRHKKSDKDTFKKLKKVIKEQKKK